jgi:hypothetical protein
VISSAALYNAAKHKGLRGLVHPTYGTSFETFLGRTSENAIHANFGEFCQGEVRLILGPMGEDFSGSCTVTSRNPLIHNGATAATKSERFDPKGGPHSLLSWGCRCIEEPFATLNFREFHL